jgi:thiol-disulfide isomerase/thioredoxin
MKTIRYYIILFTCLVFVFQSSAQKTRKVLTIGDKMPDIQLVKMLNYSKTRARISDFKGKALLLDFWEPWCSPCVASFPKLDTLQKKFKDKLQILPVTPESKEFAEKLLEGIKKAKNIDAVMTVVEDSAVSSLFEYRIIPHYVWIDATGIIKAITGADEVIEENIGQLIDGKNLELKIKKDGTLDPVRTPVFFGGSQQPFDKELIFHSVLTAYVQGIPAVLSIKKNRIFCGNNNISVLYKVAFGEGDLGFFGYQRTILEGFKNSEDSLMIGRFSQATKEKWKEIKHHNLYNYELIVPDSGFSKKRMFEIMREDLDRFFSVKGLRAKKEMRSVKVWELVRTSIEDKLKTKGGDSVDEHSDYYLKLQNKPLSAFIEKIELFYIKEGSLPIVNATKYTGNIDMEIKADLTDMVSLNNELNKYDLQLREKSMELDMIIITKVRTGN